MAQLQTTPKELQVWSKMPQSRIVDALLLITSALHLVFDYFSVLLRKAFIKNVVNKAAAKFSFGVDCEYEPKDFISEGAYGSVFRAYIIRRGDFIGEKTVAVKSVKLYKMRLALAEPDSYIRLRRGLDQLLELHHDNVVKIYKISISSDDAKVPAVELMMDYYCDGDLRNYLQKLKQSNTLLDHPTILRFLTDIASGIRYFHHNNIIHGDLKPENILVKHLKHNGKRLAIGDYDDHFKSRSGAVSNYGIERACCTPSYMSPEMMRFFLKENPGISENPGLATDIWSFGCIALDFLDCVFGDRPRKLVSKSADSALNEESVDDNTTLQRYSYLYSEGYAPFVSSGIWINVNGTDGNEINLAQCIERCFAVCGTDRITADELLYELQAAKQTISATLKQADTAPARLNQFVIQKESSRLFYCCSWAIDEVRKEIFLETFDPTLSFVWRFPLHAELTPNGQWRDCLRGTDREPLVYCYLTKFKSSLSLRFRCLNTVTDLWSKNCIPDLDEAREQFVIVKLDHHLYLLGGREPLKDPPELRERREPKLGILASKASMKSCLRVNIPRGSWEPIAPLNHDRISPSAFVLHGQIYVFGGWSKTGDPEKSMEVYCTEKDSWSLVGFPEPKDESRNYSVFRACGTMIYPS
ncbi:uncharacterized protein LOC129601585 [Paramacrobiotus metropolitanus]|uniref:uncharacterized protein LOC129601585 n=1 Tax=Paramacrobiotus metropolitanus TaxID=2943436 RepID=UPI0024460986|nr:uncharacterized protein LOC129601585 [Paramacrobiotus metropolitanus]